MPTRRQLIQKITLNANASSVTFSNIPQNYTDLKIVISARSTRTPAATNQVGALIVKPNGLTTNLSYRVLTGDGSSASSFSGASDNQVWIPSDSANWTSNTFGNAEIYIPNYSGSTNKTWKVSAVIENNNSNAHIMNTANLWSNTSAITSLEIAETIYSIKAGSTFYLYGITHVPIIRGGEEYVSGGFKYHKFTSTAALQVVEPGDVEYLVVAGGGGGAQDTGGGGGGGGFRYGKLKASHNIYQIVVGSGGTYDSNGSDSSAFTITSTGGGAGGSGANGFVGKNGGSGGGGRGGDATSRSGGLGNTPSTVPSQGNNGGNNSTSSPGYGAGGGGGSSTVGSNGSSTSGGNGGSGSAWMDGNYYSGGGGGGLYTTGTSSIGGIGGGGSGGTIGYDGIPGSINTGGGGGGSGRNIFAGINNGGSGIVIIRYPYDGN